MASPQPMTLTPRGRFVADQMLAAWMAGECNEVLIDLFRDLAGDVAADLDPKLLRDCVAVTLVSAGVEVSQVNSWLRP